MINFPTGKGGYLYFKVMRDYMKKYVPIFLVLLITLISCTSETIAEVNYDIDTSFIEGDIDLDGAFFALD